MLWPLEDDSNVSVEGVSEMDKIAIKNKEKFAEESHKNFRGTFLWKKIAKFWVSMEKLE